MRCASCHEPVSLTGVFPGGQIVCRACGVALKVPAVFETVKEARAISPYRALADPDQPSSERHLGAAESRGTCPRCLSAELVSNREDLGCPRCGGVFVGHARLQELVHAHRESGLRPVPEPSAAAAASSLRGDRWDSVTYLPCPLCATLMNRKNFGDRSGIVVDVCKRHGVWLDRGELDALIAFAFDLPEDAAVRAALLALVRRALPPNPRPAPLPSDLAPLARSSRDIESVESLLRWVGRLFS